MAPMKESSFGGGGEEDLGEITLKTRERLEPRELKWLASLAQVGKILEEMEKQIAADEKFAPVFDDTDCRFRLDIVRTPNNIRDRYRTVWHDITQPMEDLRKGEWKESVKQQVGSREPDPFSKYLADSVESLVLPIAKARKYIDFYIMPSNLAGHKENRAAWGKVLASLAEAEDILEKALAANGITIDQLPPLGTWAKDYEDIEPTERGGSFYLVWEGEKYECARRCSNFRSEPEAKEYFHRAGYNMGGSAGPGRPSTEPSLMEFNRLGFKVNGERREYSLIVTGGPECYV